MKLITLLLLSFPVFASPADCLDEVEHMSRGEFRSDYPVRVKFQKDLFEGDELFNERRDLKHIAKNGEELYTVQGSLHSGYFSYGIVMEEETCHFVKIYQIADE